MIKNALKKVKYIIIKIIIKKYFSLINLLSEDETNWENNDYEIFQHLLKIKQFFIFL